MYFVKTFNRPQFIATQANEGPELTMYINIRVRISSTPVPCRALLVGVVLIISPTYYLITYPVSLSRRGADESLTIFLHFVLSVAALMASHIFSPVHSYMLSDHFSLGRSLFIVPFTVH